MSLKKFHPERALIKAKRREWKKHERNIQYLVSSGRESEIPIYDRIFKLLILEMEKHYLRKS